MKYRLAVAALLVCAGPSHAGPLQFPPKSATAIERLAIQPELARFGLSGRGHAIVVLSELADLGHPVFSRQSIRQYRRPLTDPDLQTLPASLIETDLALAADAWHGTHVAGIIAGSCTAGHHRGIACNADVEVYDFAAYGPAIDLQTQAEATAEPDAVFFRRLLATLADVAARGGPFILNASFNIEAPYTALRRPSALEGRPFSEIVDEIGAPVAEWYDRLDAVLEHPAIQLVTPDDKERLTRLAVVHNDPAALPYGMLVPLSAEWIELTERVVAVQKAGSVVVMSEANNDLAGDSAVLNMLPQLSKRVDPDLFVSAVMLRPDEAGRFGTTLNSCGRQARDTCVVVPAHDIESAAPRGAGRLWRVESGHSMAAPMLSATIAILAERAGQVRRPADYRSIVRLIKRTANRSFPGYDPARHGVGMLDVRAALEALER